MPSVLLLDTSFAALPIHNWLVQSGFEVWTIGNRPDDVLAQRDRSHYLDDTYADFEVVQAHIDRLAIDFVVPGCTDLSIETAQQLKLRGTKIDSPEVSRRLADKAEFRGLCLELDLPAPRRMIPSELPATGLFIAKPSDAFSGRGISVFEASDPDAATRALTMAQAESRNGSALIETYIEGQLYSYSCFLEANSVTEAVIVREDGSVTPYAVDTSHVVYDFPADGTAVLKDSIERLSRHLGLVDGLLHTQFIWDGAKPWLIELCRRCPGDLYPKLIELSTGLPYAAKYASYFVNHSIAPKDHKRRCVLRHTVTAGHKNYEGVHFTCPSPVLEFHPLACLGRAVPPKERIDRVALLFLEYPNVEQLTQAHQTFVASAAYKI
jgi:hypothetical protein